MAKTLNNLLLRGVSGKIGGMVIRQMPDGSIHLSAIPDFSDRELSDAQKDHHTRFKQGAAYALCTPGCAAAPGLCRAGKK